MHKLQEQVREFHEAMGAVIRDRPNLGTIAEAQLRLRLIREETDELEEALMAGDFVEVMDAIADLLYVTYGAAVQYGVDAEPFCDEVHRSNMTKKGAQKRPDGKILKPSWYEPPVLKPLLDEQCRQ